MPLRVDQYDHQPSEPIAAVRPPAADFDQGESIRLSQPSEQRPEKGNLILKIVVGGIFAYVAVMALGLCAMMFPHQSHEIVRAVQEGVALVRPDPPRQRAVVMPSAPTPSETPAKTTKRAAVPPRKHYRRVESPNFGKVEIIESNHKGTATPRPPTPSVTVSVGDSSASQPAN